MNEGLLLLWSGDRKKEQSRQESSFLVCFEHLSLDSSRRISAGGGRWDIELLLSLAEEGEGQNPNPSRKVASLFPPLLPFFSFLVPLFPFLPLFFLHSCWLLSILFDQLQIGSYYRPGVRRTDFSLFLFLRQERRRYEMASRGRELSGWRKPSLLLFSIFFSYHVSFLRLSSFPLSSSPPFSHRCQQSRRTTFILLPGVISPRRSRISQESLSHGDGPVAFGRSNVSNEERRTPPSSYGTRLRLPSFPLPFFHLYLHFRLHLLLSSFSPLNPSLFQIFDAALERR